MSKILSDPASNYIYYRSKPLVIEGEHEWMRMFYAYAFTVTSRTGIELSQASVMDHYTVVSIRSLDN